MKRLLIAAAAGAACLILPFQGSAAAPGDVTCSQETNVFTGTARDLIVPEGGYCKVSGATITRDLILRSGAGADVSGTTVGHDFLIGPGDESGAGIEDTTIGHDLVIGPGEESGADIAGTTIGHDLVAGRGNGLHIERTTIAHDLLATQPQTVQTGRVGRNTPGGPVHVGHDFAIDGAPDLPFVFDGICSMIVDHDLRVTNRAVTLGFGIGDNCAAQEKAVNTIGHDLIVTGNTALVGFFGPSALEVGGNQVGHDLVFGGNTAAPGGFLEVADNVVGHDAICAANSPAPGKDATDGPNVAAHSNSCG